MVTALLLDLDDTLLNDRAAMAAAIIELNGMHRFAAPTQSDSIVERWDAVTRAQWARHASGEISFEEQRRERLRQTFSLSLGDAEADAIFDDYLAAYEAHWALLPGALEFLDSTAHLPRALVTNGRRSQVERKLMRLELTRRFQAVVTPDDCDARKPDPKIFLFALKQLGCSAHEVLMIGDNDKHDIAPAAALGMKIYHVDSTREDGSVNGALRLI